MYRIEPKDAKKDWQYQYSYFFALGDPKAKHDKSVLYRLPYRSGTKHTVSQSCGGRYSHTEPAERYGIDFDMPVGTDVHAMRSGMVIDLKENSNRAGVSEQFVDQANYVKILHDDGTVANYYHLKRNGVLKSRGSWVKAGERIAISGNTGYSSGPHLHVDVARAGPVSEYTTTSVPIKFKTAERTIRCPRENSVLTAH